ERRDRPVVPRALQIGITPWGARHFGLGCASRGGSGRLRLGGADDARETQREGDGNKAKNPVPHGDDLLPRERILPQRPSNNWNTAQHFAPFHGGFRLWALGFGLWAQSPEPRAESREPKAESPKPTG